MSNQTFQNSESIIPDANEIKLAQKSSKILSDFYSKKSESVDITLEGVKQTTKTVKVPGSALKLLKTILNQMADGNTVTLLSTYAELTTQEAAELLNVSRPYLIKLLENKKIPFRKIGNRRKILLQDLVAYKSKTDKARRKVLDELTKQSQKLNLGY